MKSPGRSVYDPQGCSVPLSSISLVVGEHEHGACAFRQSLSSRSFKMTRLMILHLEKFQSLVHHIAVLQISCRFRLRLRHPQIPHLAAAAAKSAALVRFFPPSSDDDKYHLDLP
nr:hypothetical protein CFP56_00430 [Quercus suber]